MIGVSVMFFLSFFLPGSSYPGWLEDMKKGVEGATKSFKETFEGKEKSESNKAEQASDMERPLKASKEGERSDGQGEQRGSAKLSVESNIRGARVLVDGKIVGNTPLSDIGVQPGKHAVEVKNDGYEVYRKYIRFETGKSMSIHVDLKRKEISKGRLFVQTNPKNTKVRILNIGPKFHQGIELDPGKYHVEVSLSGYALKKRWIELREGEDVKVDIHLEPDSAKKPSNKSDIPKNKSGKTRGVKVKIERAIKGFFRGLYGGKPKEISQFVCKEMVPQMEMGAESTRNKMIKIVYDPAHGVSYRLAKKAVDNTKIEFKGFRLEVKEQKTDSARAKFSTSITIRVIDPESGSLIPVPDIDLSDEMYVIKRKGSWKLCRPPS